MSLYLSKIRVNLNNSDVFKYQDDSNFWHKRIMEGFPSDYSNTPRKDFGLLFRIFKRVGFIEIYVQSKLEPCWDGLDWVYKVDGPKDISKLLSSFCVGKQMKFNVLAVPTYIDEDNKRRAVKGTNKKNWLVKKAIQSGFQVPYDSIHWESNDVLKNIGGKNVDIYVTEYTGILEICDVEKFIDVYLNGLGRETSYGAGLFLLSK